MTDWPDWCYCCAARCVYGEQRGNLFCSHYLQRCCAHHQQSHFLILYPLHDPGSWKGLLCCCALGKRGIHECSAKTGGKWTIVSWNIHKPCTRWCFLWSNVFFFFNDLPTPPNCDSVMPIGHMLHLVEVFQAMKEQANMCSLVLL